MFPKPSQGKVVLSNRQLQKERKKRWDAEDRICHICGQWVREYDNFCLDHVIPAQGIGAKRDSRPENLKPAHIFPCNFMKGSKKNYVHHG